MNILKTSCLALTFGVLLGYAAPASAGAPTVPADGSFLVPESRNGQADSNRKWSMPSVATVVESATASNPYDGAGLITGICVSSAPAAAYDSSATSLGYTVVRDSDTANAVSNSSIIHEQPAASVNLAAIDGGDLGAGCLEFPGDGLPFSTGLVITNSNASIITVVRYRKVRAP